MVIKDSNIEIKILYEAYVNWGKLSQQYKYRYMNSLELSNSSFARLTQKCQQSHQAGIHYYYEFKNLEVVKISKDNKEALVKGIVKLIMQKGEISYKGNFISSCCRKDAKDDWKLDDIEIEWW